MPKLVGTEHWNKEAIARTVRYLLNCVREASALGDAFSSTQVRDQTFDRGKSDPLFEARDVRLELITEALALLFVSDDLASAIGLLVDPGWVLTGHATTDKLETFDTNIRQFVRLSLFATLAGKGQIRATKEGLAFSSDRVNLSVRWKPEEEREFVSVLPVLYSIAVASRSASEIVNFLGSRIAKTVQTPTHIDLIEQPEFQFLGVYTVPEIPRQTGFEAVTGFHPLGGFVAFREMERRYSLRVRRMKQDEYRWNQLNPTGDLVDWSLLIAEVAALRSKIPFQLLPRDMEVLPEMRFCQELASALA
jgi:hypothetical protein